MAQALSPQLLAAQTSDSRQPLIQVQFGQWMNTFPLQGQLLDNNGISENSPFIMCHSSGAMLLPFATSVSGPNGYSLMLAYTDANRTLWTEVPLVPGINSAISWPVAIQIPNSQNVAIYYLTTNYQGATLNQIIVGASGNIVSGPVALTGPISGSVTSLSMVCISRPMCETGRFIP